MKGRVREKGRRRTVKREGRERGRGGGVRGKGGDEGREEVNDRRRTANSPEWQPCFLRQGGGQLLFKRLLQGINVENDHRCEVVQELLVEILKPHGRCIQSRRKVLKTEEK